MKFRLKKIRFKNAPKIRIIWPKVNLPPLTLPKLSIPKFALPKIALPKIAMPKPALPKIILPKFSRPQVKWPQVKWPQVKWPQVKWPEIKTPELKRPNLVLPKVSLPALKFPEVKLPQIKLPQIKFPQIKLPQIKFPQIKLPQIKFPEVKFPKFEIPAYKMPVWRAPDISAENMRGIAAVLACVAVFTVLQFGLGAGANVLARTYGKLEKVRDQAWHQMASADDATYLNTIVPASGNPEAYILAQRDEQEEPDSQGRYAIEEETLDIEAVLIPRENTVISSSRDGKIKSINFDNGETFKKGDILVEYVCKDLKAELEIAQSQKDLTQQKSSAGYKLFKLDIISDLEKLEFESESKQAEVRASLYETRMDDCQIRAEYDGRVIKRLANPAEFTRTDRVLMEIASDEYLKAEFLLPSRWLRWVNIGAPLSVSINETDKVYKAQIRYIYGEVDPVSQSIQVTAQLEPYQDPLLPGMSGQATLNVNDIRNAGIYGFLETLPEKSPEKTAQIDQPLSVKMR